MLQLGTTSSDAKHCRIGDTNCNRELDFYLRAQLVQFARPAFPLKLTPGDLMPDLRNLKHQVSELGAFSFTLPCSL